MTDRRLYRLFDANFNRAKEGLRVCEDIARFVLDQRSMTRSFKDVRHELTALMMLLPWKEIIGARDISKDVGKASIVSEMKRNSVENAFFANLQRVKESARVLEEMSKLINKEAAEKFKKLRYKIYALELRALKKF